MVITAVHFYVKELFPVVAKQRLTSVTVSASCIKVNERYGPKGVAVLWFAATRLKYTPHVR
jgi:hypothetical protein